MIKVLSHGQSEQGELLECHWCGVTSETDQILWGVPDSAGETVNLCEDCYYEVYPDSDSNAQLAAAA